PHHRPPPLERPPQRPRHPDLLRLAGALVVDEHPSAAGWSAGERDELTAWVAVLIDRRGEDGVQALLYALNTAS
ncbi:hypothetical protein ACFW1A_25060, partial [Kitasatospora sp. NPDC058965]